MGQTCTLECWVKMEEGLHLQIHRLAPSQLPGSDANFVQLEKGKPRAPERRSNLEAKPGLHPSMLCELKTSPITSCISTVPPVKWGEQETLQACGSNLIVTLA